MQAQQIITQVRSALVEPVPGFWTDSELLSWINRAELDFNNRTHILEGKNFTATQQGISEYPLPSNCLSVTAMLLNTAVAGDDPNWQRIMPSNLEKTMQQNPNFLSTVTDSQAPARSYMIWGRTFYLSPTPDTTGSGNLVLFFKAKPIPLALASQQLNLDDSFQDGLIAYVLWKAWEKEQEVEKSEKQEMIYEKYVRFGLRWQKKQSSDQRFRLDISSPIPLDGFSDTRYNPLA